jgi:hypothetical protein
MQVLPDEQRANKKERPSGGALFLELIGPPVLVA